MAYETKLVLGCTHKTKQQLMALAEQENCSTSEIVRRALDAYFSSGAIGKRKQISNVAYQMHKMHEDFRNLERSVLELNRL